MKYYTKTAEQFFKLVVRKVVPTSEAVKKWMDFTAEWLSKQEQGEREFIEFVFGWSYVNVLTGVENYPGKYRENLDRLNTIVDSYAVAAGLV